MAIGVAAVVISLIAMDPFLWREYFTQIAPRLHWPSGFPGNQTLPGLILRMTGQKPFAPATALLLYGSQALTLLGIVWLTARVPRDGWREPANVCAGVAALVAWLLAFSPCAWEHWPIWLAPFWGWMLWEGHRSAPRAVAAIVGLGLMYVPLSIFTNPGFFRSDLRLPDPWNSGQLAGVLLTMGLGAARLMRARARAERAGPSAAVEHPLPGTGTRAAGRAEPVGA
jgi:hypothetical protein